MDLPKDYNNNAITDATASLSSPNNEKIIIAGFGYDWSKPVSDPVTGKIVLYDGGSSWRMKYAATNILSNEMCTDSDGSILTPESICARLRRRSGETSIGTCNVS